MDNLYLPENYDPLNSDIYGYGTILNNDERFKHLISLGQILYRPRIIGLTCEIEEFIVINSHNALNGKLLIVLQGSRDAHIARWKSIKFNDEFSDYYSRREDAVFIAKLKINEMLHKLSN